MGTEPVTNMPFVTAHADLVSAIVDTGAKSNTWQAYGKEDMQVGGGSTRWAHGTSRTDIFAACQRVLKLKAAQHHIAVYDACAYLENV